MGWINKLKDLAKPYEDEDDLYDFPQKMTDELPLPPKTPAQARSSFGGFEEQKVTNKVVNHHATVQLKVALFKPERIQAAEDIADNLLKKHTIVLNLEQTNKEESRRILDFISGVVYAQEGNIKPVAAKTWLITPYNVDLLGDLIDELENNGLYF